LGPGEAYRLSFRDLDDNETDSFLTRNRSSFKPGNPNLVRWPRDDGQWLAEVRENGSYRWSVAVVRGNQLLCESDQVWVLSWRLPEDQ